MQTKDIPDSLILGYLALHQGGWTLLFGVRFHPMGRDPSDQGDAIFPPGTNWKLALSKMRSLKKRGLVGGCDCGCRGDWEITDKGLASIGQTRMRPYTGY